MLAHRCDAAVPEPGGEHERRLAEAAAVDAAAGDLDRARQVPGVREGGVVVERTALGARALDQRAGGVEVRGAGQRTPVLAGGDRLDQAGEGALALADRDGVPA